MWNHTNKGIADETKLTWIGKFRLTPPLRVLTEINSKGSGYNTSLTWGAIALPKILWRLERQGAAPSDLFVICEDSCLPTASILTARVSVLEAKVLELERNTNRTGAKVWRFETPSPKLRSRI